MSISIGTSTPSSARATHAAWLRLRGDCRQFVDHVLSGPERPEQADDRTGDTNPRPARSSAADFPV